MFPAGKVGTGIDAVLAALEDVEKSGNGWKARCSAHDDGKPSLSINVGENGKVLLHCHAECALPDILSAAGLTMADLFPSEDHAPRKRAAPAGKRKEVAAYPYHDEHGTLLFETVRLEPKTFRQRRPGPDGKPVWNLDGVRMVPYRLPELVAAVSDGQTVYIVEGEKDADTLHSWGLAATCNPMGAGKWGKVADVAGDALRGARVVILPDDDEPGRKHAQDIAARLAVAAASVKVLPHFAGSKDVTSWKESGGTKEKLEELAEAAPIWPGPTAAAGQDATTPASGNPSWIQPGPDGKPQPVAGAIRAAIEAEEVGDAHLFADLYRGQRCYDKTAGKWYLFEGNWVLHQSPSVDLDAIVEFYKAAKIEAAAKVTPDKKDPATQYFNALVKRVHDMGRVQRREHVLKEAGGSIAGAGGAFDRLGIVGDQWDREKYTLACANGVIKLTRMAPFFEFRPGRPEDYIKSVAQAEWQGIDAPAKKWEAALKVIFTKHDDVPAFLARLFGYALTGTCIEHIFVVFWGVGRNGKGTIIRTLQHVLGRGTCAEVNPEMYLHSPNKGDSSRARPDVMKLRGVRLAVASETESGRKVNAAELKNQTGGDMMKGRPLYGEEQEFPPTHTIVLQTNNRLGADSRDQGFWDRMLEVPFLERFVKPGEDKRIDGEHDVDLTLEDDLKDEASGILAWLVRGWQDYAARHNERNGAGLAPPDVVRNSTKAYRNEMDSEARFLAWGCEDVRGGKVKAGDVTDAFAAWCRENDCRGRIRLLQKMILKPTPGSPDNTGTHDKKISGGTFYLDMELTEEARELLSDTGTGIQARLLRGRK